MRNLTIKRESAFVGCLVKMKVYIEDRENFDTKINGVPCRKLGVLKNGTESTFSVTEEEARIFVICDRLSKNFSNDCFLLPAGCDDVYLSGRNRFNPLTSNSFMFDYASDESVVEHRKKIKKRGAIILASAAIVGFIFGFIIGFSSVFNDDPKTFTEREMSITLTKEFIEVDVEKFDACYSSEDITVLVSNDNHYIYPGIKDLTLNEYVDVWIALNGVDGSYVNENGLVAFEYEGINEDSGQTYGYLAAFYKSDSGFWVITFASEDYKYKHFRPDMIYWAGCVEFAPTQQ